MIKALSGARCAWEGARLTVVSSTIRRYAMIPWGIAVLVYGVAAAVFFSHLSDLITRFAGPVADKLGGALWYVFAFVGILVFCVALSFVCLVIVLIFAGAYQSAIIAEVYRQVGKPQASLGEGLSAMLAETLRTAGREVVKLIWVVPLAVLAFLLGLVPFLAPIGLVLGAWLFGYQFVDAALDVRGAPVLRRLGYSVSHALPIVMFGAAFSLLSVIPLGLVFAIPAASAGAALLVGSLEDRGTKESRLGETRAAE